MSDRIEIDGTFGEGGGQILRSALALSCVTGRAFRMVNIRGRRASPGLRRQHLTCVGAARDVSAARVAGAELRSRELAFEPGPARPGDYRFDVGSAGSATLVAQTLLPALLASGGTSRITVTGGTHNPWAPPFDFLAEVFLPAVARMGFHAEAALQRHGFYPAGGGQISLAVEPWRREDARPLDGCAPPGDIEWTGRIYDSQLPPQVIEAERSLLRRAIPAVGHIEHVKVTDSPGPGNCVMVVGRWTAPPGPAARAAEATAGAARPVRARMGEPPAGAGRAGSPDSPRNHLESVGATGAIESEARMILTAFGEKGKPARRVMDELRAQFDAFAAARSPVDEHLADQLLVYLALCGAGRFATGRASLHATTNMAVIEKFLPVKFRVEPAPAGHVISCQPA